MEASTDGGAHFKAQVGSIGDRASVHKFALVLLLRQCTTTAERILVLIALLLAAANGFGFPLLPVLFGRTVAKFSTLYNPVLAGSEEFTLSPAETLVARREITRDIQGTSKWIVIFGIAAALSTFVLAYIQIRTARRITSRIRFSYFKSLMRQDSAWYDANAVGDLSTRVTSVDVIERGIGQVAIEFVRDIFALFGGFILAFANSWRMTLVVLSFMPVIGAVGAVVAKLISKQTTACQEAHGRAGATAHETFSLIRTVLAYGGQAEEFSRYERELQDLYKCEIRKARTSAAGTGLLMMVLFCLFSGGFWFGAQFVRKGTVDLHEAIAAAAVVPSVFAAIRLTNHLKSLASAAAAARNIFEVIDRKSKMDPMDETKGRKLETLHGDIEFENVAFGYSRKSNSEPPSSAAEASVLCGFGLVVPRGTSHAIVGSSGSGKSTIINLLERFYDVSAGRILIDGVDVRDLNLRWLRSQIGHVGQMPTLFMGTVRENISLGVPVEPSVDEATGRTGMVRRCVSDAEIIAAASIANAHEFILNLPDGYLTELGEGGAQLSGGQKQRICIARALVRNPRILLLDESTASLDTKSEAVVQDALEQASKNRTTIIIAHRMSTVKHCDAISVLGNNGRVSESGSHEQLLQLSRSYKEMVELQQTAPTIGLTVGAEDSESGLDTGKGTSGSLSTHSTKDASPNASNTQGQLLKRQATSSSSTRIDTSTASDTASKGAEDALIDRGLMRRLFRLNQPEWSFILCGLIGSMIAGTAWPLAAASISELLHVGVGDDIGGVRRWSLLLLGCGALALLGTVTQNISLTVSGERMTMRARRGSFLAIINQDMGFFDHEENGTGSLTLRLNTQAALLRELTGDALACVVLGLFSVGTGTALAFWSCWRVTLSSGIFAVGILMSGVRADFSLISRKSAVDGHDDVVD